jgi:hypothetical protein
MALTDRINNNLSTLFNTDSDIYRSLICDKDGTIASTISLPTDYDIGAIASQIEYLRQLSIYLITQLYIDEQTGEFLKYTLETFFHSYQLIDESESTWISRTVTNVLQPKVSRAAIIYALRPYSSAEPEIINILTESAFADFCFADQILSGTYTMPDGIIVIYKPAYAETEESSYYTIQITLYNTTTAQIYTVQDILSRILAAGVTYLLKIIYTT